MYGLLVDHCVSRSVRDSALLLSLTERDPGPLQAVGFVEGPEKRRLRIGFYTTTLMGQEPAPAARSALERTVALCRELGHELVETSAPAVDGRALSDAFFSLAGAALADMDGMMTPILGRPLGSDDLEPFTLETLAWYHGLPGGALERALRVREEQGAALRDHLAHFDILLSPTLPVDLFQLGTLAPDLPRETLMERTEALAGYTPIHNMAGVPAMSVPLWTSPEGWPVGMHFAAPRGEDARLLRLAYELEEASPWPGIAPGFRA